MLNVDHRPPTTTAVSFLPLCCIPLHTLKVCYYYRWGKVTNHHKGPKKSVELKHHHHHHPPPPPSCRVAF
eukprot:scaffold4912_cov284-Chaetoceros_neogracile.AAC.26